MAYGMLIHVRFPELNCILSMFHPHEMQPLFVGQEVVQSFHCCHAAGIVSQDEKTFQSRGKTLVIESADKS
jgi:hypothetical protein